MQCIYSITNKNTNQCYIGTGRSAITRWKDHLNKLQRNGHNSLFQSAWNNSAITDWVFQIVETMDTNDKNIIMETEWKWIKSMESSKRLNMSNPLNMKEIKDEVKSKAVKMVLSGYTYRDVRDELGISIGTVCVAVQSHKNKLQGVINY